VTNIWENMGNTQGTFKNQPLMFPTMRDGRIPFGVTKDIAQNVPRNPGGWMDATNNAIETGRAGAENLISKANPILLGGTLGALGGVPGIAIGAGFGAGVVGLDKITDGGASKILQAGANNLRSNYAFARDLTEKNTGMGLLAGLTMIAGGILGGAAGLALGPAGAVVGAGLGANIAGKLSREAGQTELAKNISSTLYQSAKYSDTNEAKVQYNFGRDVVQSAGKITTWNTLGDTTKGIGAIVSGVLNFGFELTAGADVLALKGTGLAGRRVLNRPIQEPVRGIATKVFSKAHADQIALRRAEQVRLIDEAVAGKENAWTPKLKFLEENDIATIKKREEWAGPDGMVAATLLAGQKPAISGEILKAGIGDTAAIKKLELEAADKWSEIVRYNDALDMGSVRNNFSINFKGQSLSLNPATVAGKANRKKIQAEIDALKVRHSWLDDALSLGGPTGAGTMLGRTTARFATVERWRNDLAKVNAAKAVGAKNVVPMETKLGAVYQQVFQANSLSRPFVMLDRGISDAPRPTINFNEPLAAADRMQASIRSAVRVGAIDDKASIDFNNTWLKSRTEEQKLQAIEKYVATGFRFLGNKHGVASNQIEHIVSEYNSARRSLRNEAKLESVEKKGYMNDPADPLDGAVISDPQLISQLANGDLLPDWKYIDKVLSMEKKASGPMSQSLRTRKEEAVYLANEVNSLWRTGTLLRTGYPANVIKDSYIRAWGDGALFNMFKYLGKDAIDAITNSGNTVSKVSRWTKATTNKNYNLKKISNEVNYRQRVINNLDKSLEQLGIDPNNLPKKSNNVPIIARGTNWKEQVANRNALQGEIDLLRLEQSQLVSNRPMPRVSKKDVVIRDGVTFSGALEGPMGILYRSKIDMKDNLRAALATDKELGIDIQRANRDNIGSLAPTDVNHMPSWVSILKDKLAFDPVARLIMEGKTKKEVVQWFRNGSSEAAAYLDRFSSNVRDAGTIYERVKVPVDMYAPNAQLRAMTLKGEVNLDSLTKLYPDINQRPPVFGQLVDDMTGNSKFNRDVRTLLKDGVAWLSTKPTATLAFNPYFRVKYEESLQGQLFATISKGIDPLTLSLETKKKMENRARQYAETQFKEKINSFHRDMNYNGVFSYLVAFFPAIIEQFRAYGKITIENPDFIIKKMAIQTIPSRFGIEEEDSNGNRYVPVKLPLFGGMEMRLPSAWFNPDNPTGGSLVSAHPFAAVAANELSKKYNAENWFTQWALPFGAQKNSLNALTPNTARRLYQVWQAKNEDGVQFNKDTFMFEQQLAYEYQQNNGKIPSAKAANKIYEEAKDRAFKLSVLRAFSAATLPVQGPIVTSLSAYVDELNQLEKDYGAEGATIFAERYPDAWMFMDRLSDSTSGIRPDATAAALVKKNKATVQKIVAGIGTDNLNVLGAIFNDDNYAFSAGASAYLQNTKIPGGGGKTYRDVQDALGSFQSSIVGKGWNDWFALEEIVRSEYSKQAQPIDITKGFGAQMLKDFKNAFVEQAKTNNNQWYQEYIAQSFGGAGSRQADTVKAITIALNDEKLWSDLQKQPKYHALANYMSYRYDVKAKLDAMGATIDSPKSIYLREEVASTVNKLRAMDINFDKLYMRYFENDKFDFVYDESGD